MIMEILINILGYGIIAVVLVAVVYIFGKLLATALEALSNNDD